MADRTIRVERCEDCPLWLEQGEIYDGVWIDACCAKSDRGRRLNRAYDEDRPLWCPLPMTLEVTCG